MIARLSALLEQPRSAALILGLAALLSFFAGLGAAPLFDWDEGAFAEASREMLVTGDYVSIQLNGTPRHAKPVLVYWLQAISMHLFGVNEVAARLPSALAALAWTFLTFWFIRRIADARTGFFAAFFLAVAAGPALVGAMAIADALLNLFIAASMYAIFLYIREKRRLWVYAAFFAMGLGFLTKGPIAVLIPGVVSFLFFAWRREWKRFFLFWLSPIGIALFLAVTAPWYVANFLADPEFLVNFLMYDNLERFSGSGEGDGGMEGHGGPFYYYAIVVPGLLLPWTALLFRSFAQLARREELLRPERLFFAFWFGFVFLFFSFSSTKLPHYVLYGCTPLFLFAAFYLDDLRRDVWLFLPATLFFGVGLALPEIAAASRDSALPYYQIVIDAIPSAIGAGYRIVMGLGLILGLGCMFAPQAWRPAKLLLTGLAMTGALHLALIPAGGRLLQRPVTAAADFAQERGLDVVMWRAEHPSYLFYAETTVPSVRLFHPGEILHLPTPGEIVFLRKPDLAKLGGYAILFEDTGIVLARVTAMEQRHYARLLDIPYAYEELPPPLQAEADRRIAERLDMQRSGSYSE